VHLVVISGYNSQKLYYLHNTFLLRQSVPGEQITFHPLKKTAIWLPFSLGLRLITFSVNQSTDIKDG
jgi:hypothetical protein